MDSNNDQQEDLDDSSDDAANATAERVYFESGNSKKQLYLMCLGVKDDGVSIFDLEEELWKKSSKRREIKPVRSEYAREVLRRSEILITEKTKRPKATNWPIQRSLEWLEANPIQDEVDVLFLKGQVSRIKDVITQRQQEEAQEQLQEQGINGMSWRGALPYLRLIMCRLEQLEDLAREDQRSVRRCLDELEDQAREYRRRYAETDDQDSRKARFYLEEEQRIMVKIASMEESTLATPTRQNTTPRT
jgi:hypothetical protein